MTRRVYLFATWSLFCVFAATISETKAEEKPTIGVEPIIGFERTQQLLPSPHSVNQIVYGARLTGGYSILSVEGEYTRGMNEEATLLTTQKTTSDKLKLGLRTSYSIKSLFSFHLRAGVQAKQVTYEETLGGVTTIDYQPIVYNPYAGTGFRVTLTPKIYGSMDVVAVVPNVNDMSQNDYLLTAGFVVGFP